MNTLDKNFGCFDCGDSRINCGGCGPASYDCNFSITAAPYDPSTWNVSWCGKLHQVKIPQIQQTDTSLSTNYSNATLNYQAEQHTDIIPGKDLGGLITVGNLRDTNVDYNTEALCYELIYHKYGDCGEGCQSIQDEWSTFSIDSTGALQSQIRYPRGANAYGCPIFLQPPSTESQYWLGAWQANGGFTYTQPLTVSKLPTDPSGDPYVLSQDPATKRPLVGTLPLNCILNNLLSNLAVNAEIGFEVIQATPKFEATANPINGEFDIEWNDWYFNFTKHCGTGHIIGKITWDYTFDLVTGTMNYTITDVYVDRVTYQPDPAGGAPVTAEPLYLTLAILDVATGARTTVVNRYQFTSRDPWSIPVQTHVASTKQFSIAPGQTGPKVNFLYMYNDWEGSFDDEGYLNIALTNTLRGWNTCF